MDTAMIKLLIADDDAIIREGLKMIIETQPDLEFAGAAADGKQAVEMCRELRPDVTMLDIRMPVMDGIAAAQAILSENLSVPLLLTTFDEPDFILRALKAGINGYILKNSPADRILSAIRVLHAGGTVFQADILEFIRSKGWQQCNR
jgi:DNA-binding NarL/FixJ family response regulator